VPPVPLDPSGYEFGDLRVSVLHTPGHTPGSVAYRIDPPGYVFVGDTVVHGPTWLHLEESEPVTSLLYSLRALAKFACGARRIFCSHSPDPIPYRIVEAFPSFLEQVARGDIAGRHIRTFAGEGLVYYLEEPYGVLLPTQIGA
jgi:glyoxylase-like metal-dependent hydrolase (beta-lactamase superfamily II)